MAAVGEIVDDNDDDVTQCTQHPFKNTSPGGGICALCLQDKLGKLLSSSSSSSSFLPFSSSSSTTTTTTTTTTRHDTAPRLPFLLTPKKNKSFNDSFALKRSKSTTHYDNNHNTTPRRKGFWSSLLHLPHKKTTPVKQPQPPPRPPQQQPALPLAMSSSSSVQLVVVQEEEEEETVNKNETLYQGKVTRSRSVGCGSRSFSGDFFERISTGFADCSTLRRVESHREGGTGSGSGSGRIKHRHSTSTAIREKVLCGGLFGGFMMITSSSSSTSTSSSSYWVNGDHNNNAPAGRNKSNWGWALASPRRAFSRPKEIPSSGTTTATTTTTAAASDVSKTPDLGAIPSLLSVRT